MAKLYPVTTAHNHDEIYAKIGEGGVTDHGLLTGLEDNDHPQYLLAASGKAADSDKLDGIDSTGFATAGHDHDSDYLGISAKAADSDKLDGLDSTDFGRPVFLTTPLTSTSWDGDLYSTTSKTLIDLSTVFGAPAGIKAILAEYSIKDSGSSNGTCRLVLSANNANMTGVHLMGSPTNNHFATSNAIIPCDVNGDIYYQVVASGTNTMTIYIQILGYWL